MIQDSILNDKPNPLKIDSHLDVNTTEDLEKAKTEKQALQQGTLLYKANTI